MQKRGIFEISRIASFNKKDSGTFFFGDKMSIFLDLDARISVTGTPGDPKNIFFDIFPIEVLNMS